MRALRRFAPLVLLVLGTACGHAKLVASVRPTPQPSGYLFANVNVFDGEQPLGPRDVLIRKGRIEAVAPAGTLTEQDVVRVDGTGKTLLPGFVDAHAPDGFPISLIRAILPWPLSRLATGNIRTAATVEEAREVVDDVAREFSPPLFKVTSDALPPGTPKLSGEVLTAAIQRARERKMRSVGHIGAPEDVMIAAEAGLDLFAHPPREGCSPTRRLPGSSSSASPS